MDDQLGALGLLTRPLDAGLVLETLREVIDPEPGVNIVDLGLVYDVAIAAGGSIAIEMTLTIPGCPIGDLCPVCGSLLASVGDLAEIVAYRVIETRGSTSHSGAASGAGQLIADRVGEIIAQRKLKHARVRLEIERFDAHSASPRAPGTGDDAVRRRRRAPTTAAPPRLPRLRRLRRVILSFRRRAPSALTAPPDEVCTSSSATSYAPT